MIQIAIALATVLALIGGGVYAHRKGDAAGFERRSLMCKSEIADIRSHAEEVARQAQAEREKGRLLADKLATQLADTKDRLTASQRSLQHEINRRASATRRAFADDDIVRQLNREAVITERVEPVGAGQPAAARVAAADAAAIATDRSGSRTGASEKAVATWIANARASYATCAATLTALQTWARSVTQ